MLSTVVFVSVLISFASASSSEICHGLVEQPRIVTVVPKDFSSPAIYSLIAQRNVQNVSIYGLNADGGLSKPLVLSDFGKLKTPRPASTSGSGLSLISAFVPSTGATAGPSYGVSVPLKGLHRSDTDWYVTCADHLDVIGGEKHFCSYCTVSRARPLCDNDTASDPSLNQPCGVDYTPVEVLSAEYFRGDNSMLVRLAVDELPTAQANVVVTVKPSKCAGQTAVVRKSDLVYPGSFVSLNITDLPEKKFTAKYRVYLDLPVRTKQANFLSPSNAISYTTSTNSAAADDTCGDEADETGKKGGESKQPEGIQSALEGISSLFNNFGAKISTGGVTPKR